MGGGQKFQIPDYRMYKWEDVPQLQQLQAKLAEKGLKDPWARNHVWKYMNPYNNNSQMKWYQTWKLPGFNRGAVIALAVMGVYIAVDKAIGSKDDGHGHH